MMDLRTKGEVGVIGMVGTSGDKYEGILAHMEKKIVKAYPASGMKVQPMKTWPEKGVKDYDAYKKAMETYPKGSCVTIFTPDDTHFKIAKYALSLGLHVLVTKPPVKTLADHLALQRVAQEAGVLCMVEVHKRFDPIYVDARDRIRKMRGFGYMNAYMSQPKHQLETFRAWAGRSSDISYYLNSHHIDFHEWCCGDRARPESVVAMASSGVATGEFGIDTEDTITLVVQWTNVGGAKKKGKEAETVPSMGTAVCACRRFACDAELDGPHSKALVAAHENQP